MASAATMVALAAAGAAASGIEDGVIADTVLKKKRSYRRMSSGSSTDSNVASTVPAPGMRMPTGRKCHRQPPKDPKVSGDGDQPPRGACVSMTAPRVRGIALPMPPMRAAAGLSRRPFASWDPAEAVIVNIWAAMPLHLVERA